MDVVIAGAPTRALVDTGANVSFMSDDFVKLVGIACGTRNAHSASLADGSSVGITGCTPKPFVVGTDASDYAVGAVV